MLDAALSLLSERKTLSFSLAEVAERAGYSRGLPTQTFGTKVELIRALVPHLRVRAEEVFLSPYERGEGLTAVMTTVRALLDAPDTQVQIMIALHVLFAESTRPDSPYRDVVAALNRSSVGYLSHHLRIAVERGEVRPDLDCRAQAMMIMAGIRGLLLQWLIDPERMTLERMRVEVLASLHLSLTAKLITSSNFQ